MPRSRGHLVWLVRLWPRLSPLSCSRTKQGGERLGGLEEVRGCNCIVVGGIDRYINKGLLQSIEPGSTRGIRRRFGIHGSILNSIVVSSKSSTLHPGSLAVRDAPPYHAPPDFGELARASPGPKRYPRKALMTTRCLQSRGVCYCSYSAFSLSCSSLVLFSHFLVHTLFPALTKVKIES